MKKIGTISAITLLAGCLVLTGCSSGSQTATDKGNDGGFQAVEAEKSASNQPSFDEANVLKFDLANRDDDSFEEVIATFTVSNGSESEIDYFSADFAYRDADGNVLCDDGRFNDFGVPAGKSSLMESYSSLDGSHPKGSVADIHVSSYSYQSGGKTYNIDLDSETVSVYEPDDNGVVDFDEANVLSFEYSDKGVSSIGTYEVDIKAVNNGRADIPYISIDMAYFDEAGNLIGTDGRFNDNKMGSGNFVSLTSVLAEEEQSPLVSSFGIYSYEYRLNEDDENGFNHYEVNLKTKQAKGMHVDYQN